MSSVSPSLVRMTPMITVMGIIFFLSHTPGEDLQFVSFPGLDKVAHLIMYGALATTVICAFAENLRADKPLVVAILTVSICTLYGITDEWHQSFIPGRSVSTYDIAADAIGAAVVAIFWIWLNKRLK